MIEITNEKVAGFAPLWAPFRGFSLLFDDPGRSLAAPVNGIACLVADVETEPAFELLRALAVGLEEMGGARLTNEYLFCPLPPSSYHVTVWDGVNAANVVSVVPGRRSECERLLRDLPDSAGQPGRLAEIADSELLRRPVGELALRFDRLANWSDVSIVATLAAADNVSAQALGAVADARARLNARFRLTFGVAGTESWVPHVTLGYFADRAQGGRTRERLDAWETALCRRTLGLTLRVGGISSYGFTEMATFWKAV